MSSAVERISPLLAGQTVHAQLPVDELIRIALERGEAKATANGAIVAMTGDRTGRSPKDKFIVDDSQTRSTVEWGRVNLPISTARFDALLMRVLEYLGTRTVFVEDLFCGADANFRLPVRVLSEYAWHALFAHQLFLRPTEGELAEHQAAFTVIAAPEFEAVPERDGTHSKAFILTDFSRQIILIGGTRYAGEIKKSIFGVMNYLLPQRGVLPMHCSANIGEDGSSALFFGLSGTGKTTLSADRSRRLIGDDEHGWGPHGIFNFEGGCYAKCADLTEEREPEIYRAIRHGSVLENVALLADGQPDYHDLSATENTRVAYPIDYMENAEVSGQGPHPRHVLFLAADAFGVLPPIARLSSAQAMYHFLSGYTAKLAGTEAGMGHEPQPEFSACFGAPFLPLSPNVYAEMLGHRLAEHNTQCWLVNTGWSGGAYGTGSRMSLSVTRALIRAALAGELDELPYGTERTFGLRIPTSCPGVPSELLNPRHAWHDKMAYDRAAHQLAQRFKENFRRFNAPSWLTDAGPR